MSFHNQIQIIGNVGIVPTLRSKTEAIPGSESRSVVTFAIAENVNTYDDKLDRYVSKEPNWYHCVAFGKVGDRVLSHVKKGELIQVMGSIRTSQYVNAEGVKRTTSEIRVSDIFKVSPLPNKVEAIQLNETALEV